MKRGRFAKEGLIQYRIVCQGVNVNSLEEVIKHFLKLASERAEAAQAEAAVAVDCEDLEATNTPENLMLSYVSGEKGKDRTDRQTVTPWFKNDTSMRFNSTKVSARLQYSSPPQGSCGRRTAPFWRSCATTRSWSRSTPVSYTHLRAHETGAYL
eukprot:3024059-Pyramimonas_sp.AAC.1